MANFYNNKANIIRNADLKSILKITGCIRDKYDKAKWHTPKGTISVTGAKFINWNRHIAGGGAIDLVMHLNDYDFKTALLWLSDRFSSGIQTQNGPQRKTLKLPQKDDSKLKRVIQYLTYSRCIPLNIVTFLINSSKLYADNKGNAVFLLLGKKKRIVGAELRGTGNFPWRGMAPGSRKDIGFFYVKKSDNKKVVLCESAIDAISFSALYPHCTTISTSGATTNPAWLKLLINESYKVYCGFDADDTGDAMAKKMIKLYPAITRLRPCKNDWNEVLICMLKGDSLPATSYQI